jgi:ADP-dependent phosphofructokinase/glucokinase
LEHIQTKLNIIEKRLNVQELRQYLNEYSSKIDSSDFYKTPGSQEILKKHGRAEEIVEYIDSFQNEIQEQHELLSRLKSIIENQHLD